MSQVGPGELLGDGRTAQVHAWGRDRALKLFQPDTERSAVEREAINLRAAAAAGLPVPAPGDIVQMDGRLGLEMERVRGVRLLDLVLRAPWTARRAAHLMADLHLEVHRRPGSAELASFTSLLGSKLAAAPLSPGTRAAVEAALSFLPQGNVLCHGDLHPGHVILGAEGPVLIDWADAGVGHPLADVARTAVALAGSAAAEAGIKRLPRLALRLLLRLYEARYFRAAPSGRYEYESWLSVMAAVRLGEGIPALEPWLRRRVQRDFGS